MTKPTGACVPSKDFDQPGHPPSLIKVFTVGMEIKLFVRQVKSQTIIDLKVRRVASVISCEAYDVIEDVKPFLNIVAGSVSLH